MFLSLSGRRADWSKLTPAHLPFSCKISHREVWLLVSFSSWGGLRSPFCVLELCPPETCLKTEGSRHRGDPWVCRMLFHPTPLLRWGPAALHVAPSNLGPNSNSQPHRPPASPYPPDLSNRNSRRSVNQGGWGSHIADHRSRVPEGYGEGLGEVQGWVQRKKTHMCCRLGKGDCLSTTQMDLVSHNPCAGDMRVEGDEVGFLEHQPSQLFNLLSTPVLALVPGEFSLAASLLLSLIPSPSPWCVSYPEVPTSLCKPIVHHMRNPIPAPQTFPHSNPHVFKPLLPIRDPIQFSITSQGLVLTHSCSLLVCSKPKKD